MEQNRTVIVMCSEVIYKILPGTLGRVVKQNQSYHSDQSVKLSAGKHVRKRRSWSLLYF